MRKEWEMEIRAITVKITHFTKKKERSAVIKLVRTDSKKKGNLANCFETNTQLLSFTDSLL